MDSQLFDEDDTNIPEAREVMYFDEIGWYQHFDPKWDDTLLFITMLPESNDAC